jgi:uncharacterized Zn finger protein (UPF0148 family)
MNCPICQTEMATGHLYSTGGIDWVSDEQPDWKKFLLIGNLRLGGTVTGFHCRRCGHLIIPHDRLKEQE